MFCPVKLDSICLPYLLQNFKVSPKNLISHSNQPKLGLPIMNTLWSSTSSNNATPNQIPSFFGNRDDDIFVHQDLTPPAAHFFPNVAIDNVAIDNVADILYDNNSSLDGNHLNCADPFMVNLLHPRWKKPDVNYSSKHRPRKIVTAQGQRDRRVRLSIQIARQFFDLQDTLGFDKASKTLEWLLTKSKSAIEEAVKMKHTSNAAIEQEKVTEAAEIGDNFERSSSVISTNYTTSSNFNVVTKKESLMQQKIHSNYLVAKELRAKARERARERTKAKISIRKLEELNKLGSDFGHINFPTTWNYQLSSHSMVPYFNTYQQNYASSKQVPIDSPSTMENWEISNNFWQESAISTADLQYVYGGKLYMPVATSS